MGKVRRYRQKYHLSKAGSSKSAAETKTPSVIETKPKSIDPNENIFSGIDISVDSLTKSLPHDFDARSIASTKSRKELKLEEQHLKKKVKKKLRHERFLQKLDVMQQAVKAAKERDRRRKRPIIGDLDPLKDALPSLDELVTSKFKYGDKKCKPKPKGIMKMKKRLQQQTKDAKLMKKILKDKKFKLNPGQTIIQFLQQKVALERS